WHGRRRQGFRLRQCPRTTRASGAGRPLPAEWHHGPRRGWSGIFGWQALVAASGSGVDGPRLARWWRWLSANDHAGQRDAAADRRLPNLERAADGRDAILTRLHLAVDNRCQPVNRKSQLVAVVDEPDDRRCGRPAERLEAAEVDGRLDPRLESSAPHVIGGLDGDTRFNLADLSLERRDQALVRKQGRKDAPGQLPEFVERLLR